MTTTPMKKDQNKNVTAVSREETIHGVYGQTNPFQ